MLVDILKKLFLFVFISNVFCKDLSIFFIFIRKDIRLWWVWGNIFCEYLCRKVVKVLLIKIVVKRIKMNMIKLYLSWWVYCIFIDIRSNILCVLNFFLNKKFFKNLLCVWWVVVIYFGKSG